MLVPWCPQTIPRKAGTGGYIQNAYGERRTINVQLPTLKGQAKPPQAE